MLRTMTVQNIILLLSYYIYLDIFRILICYDIFRLGVLIYLKIAIVLTVQFQISAWKIVIGVSATNVYFSKDNNNRRQMQGRPLVVMLVHYALNLYINFIYFNNVLDSMDFCLTLITLKKYLPSIYML